MDDIGRLAQLNDQFVDAWRKGAWEMLDPILAAGFQYLDGTTGQIIDRAAYADELRHGAQPNITFDQVVIHAIGDVAVVSARTSDRPGRHSRYIDTYERSENGWRCIHACVWPLREGN